jgi:hypothetical protein
LQQSPVPPLTTHTCPGPQSLWLSQLVAVHVVESTHWGSKLIVPHPPPPPAAWHTPFPPHVEPQGAQWPVSQLLFLVWFLEFVLLVVLLWLVAV